MNTVISCIRNNHLVYRERSFVQLASASNDIKSIFASKSNQIFYVILCAKYYSMIDPSLSKRLKRALKWEPMNDF